jgi:hypothetical protein
MVTQPVGLRDGDRLTRPVFERRLFAAPRIKHAELVDGLVVLHKPGEAVFAHARFSLIGWLGAYAAGTSGVVGHAHARVRLDLDNEPQPDGFLRIIEAHGGQSRVDKDGFVVGAPELVVEVAHTSVSYDLHAKLNVYRRHGVREYVVWRTGDRAIDYFALRDGAFVPVPPGAGGVFKSVVFPGLWLDARALIAGQPAQVLATLQKGIRSKSHAAFVAGLGRAKRR